MTEGASNKEAWARSATAAERAFAVSDRAAQRMEAAGAARHFEQLDRLRRTVEGPARQYVDAVERARQVAQGPARQYVDAVERARQVAQGPARQYIDAVERARQATQGPVQSLLASIERTRVAVEGPARRLQEHYRRLDQVIKRYDLGAALQNAAAAGALAERALKASLPMNWRSLSLEDAEKVERLVRQEGIPLVWVPGPALTAELAAKGTAADAMALLLAEQEVVLNDVERALDEVTEQDLAVLVGKARKAIGALRDGHGDAAQALAAAVFTATLHEGLGLKDLQDVRKQAANTSPDRATLATYRGTLVVLLASRYVQGRGYELPGFNRSTTLHRVEDAQYTPANNLAAVMAAGGLLREAQARRHAHALKPTTASTSHQAQSPVVPGSPTGH